MWGCRALGGITGNEWKPRVLCRRQLCHPQKTLERDTCPNLPFTRPDLTRCHRSCCQPLKILTLQAVLFPTEAGKGSHACACIQTHERALLPGRGTSQRYHPCPFATWITALGQRVSALQARGAGWISVHFHQHHPSQGFRPQSKTETLGGCQIHCPRGAYKTLSPSASLCHMHHLLQWPCCERGRNSRHLAIMSFNTRLYSSAFPVALTFLARADEWESPVSSRLMEVAGQGVNHQESTS